MTAQGLRCPHYPSETERCRVYHEEDLMSLMDCRELRDVAALVQERVDAVACLHVVPAVVAAWTRGHGLEGTR